MKRIVFNLLALYFIFFCCISSNGQMRKIYFDEEAVISQYQKNNAVLKFSFYTASEGFVAFSNSIGYTTDSGKSFIKKIYWLKILT